jgi:hypothetical protein
LRQDSLCLSGFKREGAAKEDATQNQHPQGNPHYNRKAAVPDRCDTAGNHGCTDTAKPHGHEDEYRPMGAHGYQDFATQVVGGVRTTDLRQECIAIGNNALELKRVIGDFSLENAAG